jgi:hypothetical protein
VTEIFLASDSHTKRIKIKKSIISEAKKYPEIPYFLLNMFSNIKICTNRLKNLSSKFNVMPRNITDEDISNLFSVQRTLNAILMAKYVLEIAV